MIDSEFHVQLNGVKYRLAEDSEGTHYDKKLQPLRAQSAGVVQGDSGKFQLRPDSNQAETYARSTLGDHHELDS